MPALTREPTHKRTADAAAIHQRYAIDTMRESGGHPFDLRREFFRHGRAGSWREELSPRDRYWFHATAGDLLCALGYADESWWIERGYQRWLTPLLAGVGVRRRLGRLVERLRPS